MVIKAGVGIPVGVIGTPLIHLHLPKRRSSASAGGV